MNLNKYLVPGHLLTITPVAQKTNDSVDQPQAGRRDIIANNSNDSKDEDKVQQHDTKESTMELISAEMWNQMVEKQRKTDDEKDCATAHEIQKLLKQIITTAASEKCLSAQLVLDKAVTQSAIEKVIQANTGLLCIGYIEINQQFYYGRDEETVEKRKCIVVATNEEEYKKRMESVKSQSDRLSSTSSVDSYWDR